MADRGAKLPKLAAWRNHVGIYQKTLSERTGLTVATISRIEHGGVASFDTIDKLASGLGITSQELRFGEPVPEKKRPAA